MSAGSGTERVVIAQTVSLRWRRGFRYEEKLKGQGKRQKAQLQRRFPDATSIRVYKKEKVIRAIKGGRFILTVRIEDEEHEIWLEKFLVAYFGSRDIGLRALYELCMPETVELALHEGRRGTEYWRLSDAAATGWARDVAQTNTELDETLVSRLCWRAVNDAFKHAADAAEARMRVDATVAELGDDIADVTLDLNDATWAFSATVKGMSVEVSVAI